MGSITTIVTIAIPILVIAAIGVVVFFARRQPAMFDDQPPAQNDPRYQWVLTAIAMYQGEIGDPGLFPAAKAQKWLSGGWSTHDVSALMRLIQKYSTGECNVAFDKLRIIFLARLGRGAGWIAEDSSWGHVFWAMEQIKENYKSWEELRVASDEGRADWYGGPDEVPEEQRGYMESNYAYAKKAFFSKVRF